jgi:predicted NBD/HSP70 family sugar kinase
MSRKEYIKAELLKELCFKSQLTRLEFIKSRGIRAATVFAAVDELKNAGLVCEPERKGEKTGRKSPLLKLNPACGCFAGLELQAHRLTGVMIDGGGKIVTKAVLSFDDNSDLRKLTLAVDQLLLRLKTQSGSDWNKLRGIGFADPGLVDIQNKISLRAVNLPGWENVETGRILRQMTACSETLVVPETVARTFAEYYSRCPKSPKSLFQMSLDAGIGGGFIKNGELFIGDSYRGMEIGHIVISPNGPLCQCGNRGCLEAVAGEFGIKRKINELIVNGVDTELSIEDFSLAAFVRAAGRDRAAMALANEVCESISLGLATVIALLNPSTIVLSGELTKLGNVLMNTIKRILGTHCFQGAVENLSLEISTLDEYAAATAAAVMCRNQLIMKS